MLVHQVPLWSQEDGFFSKDISLPLDAAESKLDAVISGWKEAKVCLKEAANSKSELCLDNKLMIGRLLAHRYSDFIGEHSAICCFKLDLLNNSIEQTH